MAKKYNVTFANGTEQTVNSKKAVRELEGIVSVTLNGQDITNEFVKEEEVMVKNIDDTQVVDTIEAPEAQAEVVDTIEAPEGPKATLLFTASRGNARRLTWKQIIINPEDEVVKIRGCAAMLPVQVAEAIGSTKFVSWFDQKQAEQCVAEGTQVRGMASTFSDVFARYIKVNEIKGANKLETVLAIFKSILNDIEAGVTEGGWARPEPEAPKAEDEGEISNTGVA